jgi:hypothetical protein
MKLRIAHIDTSDRMAGKFVVQRRYWGSWWDMYFNCDTKVLKKSMELGDANLKKASFDDFHEAMRYAQIFKQNCGKKIIIREVWRV